MRKSKPILVVLMLLPIPLFVACIAGMGILGRMPLEIMPPEPQERVEKRASMDNAYHLVQKAVELLPVTPGPMQPVRDVSADPAGTASQSEVAAASLAEVLGWAQDPGEEVALDFLARSGAAFAAFREASGKPFYLPPLVREDLDPDFGRMYAPTCPGAAERIRLNKAFVAEGVRLARAGRAAEAMEHILAGLRLGAMVGADGDHLHNMHGAHLQEAALKRIPEVSVYVESTEILEKAERELARIAELPLAVPAHLEFLWRRIDCEPQGTLDMTRGGSIADRAAGYFSRQTLWWKDRRARAFIRRHRDEILSGADIGFADFPAWYSANKAGPFEVNTPWGSSHAEVIADMCVTECYRQMWCRGSRIAVALEREQRALGEYPKALDQLAPDFIDGVPDDPVAGTAYRYSSDGADYFLYSMGPDGTDQEGREYDQGNQDEAYDVVIYRRAAAAKRAGPP